MSRSTAATATALQELRVATSADHRRLDHAPLVRGLLDRRSGVAEYTRFMCCLRRAYTSIEPALVAFERAGGAECTPVYRCRLLGIERELSQLGAGPDRAGALPPLVVTGVAGYWGVRYVLDGSCHGALRLAPGLSGRAALGARTDFAYWQELIALAPHWPAIVARIEAAGAGVAQREALVNAARAAFACFTRVFERVD